MEQMHTPPGTERATMHFVKTNLLESRTRHGANKEPIKIGMKKDTSQKERKSVASIKPAPGGRKSRTIQEKRAAEPVAETRPAARNPVALLAEHLPGTTVQLVVLEYANDAAAEVFVAGTFNDWNLSAAPLTKSGDGLWSRRLLLEPGEYEYRFIVDGHWQDDPAAERSAANPFGGSNSILVVEAL